MRILFHLPAIRGEGSKIMPSDERARFGDHRFQIQAVARPATPAPLRAGAECDRSKCGNGKLCLGRRSARETSPAYSCNAELESRDRAKHLTPPAIASAANERSGNSTCAVWRARARPHRSAQRRGRGCFPRSRRRKRAPDDPAPPAVLLALPAGKRRAVVGDDQLKPGAHRGEPATLSR